MTLVALDPGPVRSALVVMAGPDVTRAVHDDNAIILGILREWASTSHLVIEQIEGMGMAVGAETFETVFWSGRFIEAWDAQARPWSRLTRRAVKLHLCGTSRAKDPNVRQALIDRYGGSAAKGTKRQPGPLYGISADLWAALAVGVTYQETVAA